MIDRVIGNYRIVEKVGEGGMGTVYRAVDLMLEREVAIKAIRPELSREPEIVERFRAEARMLARLNHPAIATIYSFFMEGGDLFLAMEFVRGRSLSWLLQNGGPLPWERAVPLLSGALDGIEQAHRAGIVHRDIKSDNLMIAESGVVKVMDFGIGRLIGSSRLTRTGLLVGTLHYMAPEQIRGEEVDRRADIYALGAVLYEMLTGRVPFAGGSDFAVLKAHVEENPAPPSAAIAGLPSWLDAAILKALAKMPAERFQTVEELRLFLLGQGSPAAAGLAAFAPIAPIVLPLGEQPTMARAPAPAGAAGTPPAGRPSSPTPPGPRTPAGANAPAASAAWANAAAAGWSEAGPGPGSTAVSGTTLAPPPVPPAGSAGLPAPAQSPVPAGPPLVAPAVPSPAAPMGPSRVPPMATPEQLGERAGPGTAGTSLGPGWTVDSSGGALPATGAAAAGGRRPARLAVLAVAVLAAAALLYRTFAAPAADQPRSPPAPPAAAAGGSGGTAATPSASAANQATGGSQTGPATGNGPPAAPATAAAAGVGTAQAAPGTAAAAGVGTPQASPGTAAAGGTSAPQAPPAAPSPESAAESGTESQKAGRQEERGARGGSGAAPGGAAPGAARALPAEELRLLSGEIETESGQIRNLYADFLFRKGMAGKPLTGSDGKLKDELKDLQHAAESFGAPFRTGFWARTRSRLGRLGHSEDQNAQITRLARDLVGSGSRADALMAQVKPDPAVRQLWRHLRRQWRRVAEICGV
jgi:tRNA A-37 threonylcarbamoyl transferase component Bud32